LDASACLLQFQILFKHCVCHPTELPKFDHDSGLHQAYCGKKTCKSSHHKRSDFATGLYQAYVLQTSAGIFLFSLLYFIRVLLV
jgi:hypothetical protein